MSKEKKTCFFRNISEIFINDTIDPESLWRLEGDLLVLVDDDQHITVNYNDHKNEFIEVFDQK